MSDPARRARPVGPPPSGSPPPPRRDPGEDASEGKGEAGATPPYVRVYRWSSSGRSIPWFAILLLVLGVGLLIEVIFPALSFGAIVILAAGLAFGALWLFGHVVGATMPALVLTAWGLASIGRDVELLVGDGWNTLFIGLAFLIGWAIARYQGTRRQYALWIGLVLGVIGLADTSDTLPFDLNFLVVIPLLMIALGVYLVWQSRAFERR